MENNLMPSRRIKIIDQYSGGDFNARDARLEGFTGVIFKAGQGAWADVPRYKPGWWSEAKAEGLHRGWYWLVDSRYHSSDHIKEMERINLFSDLGELGLWLDVEKPRISWKEAEYLATKYKGIGNVIDTAYLLGVRGVPFGIYTGPGAYELVTRGATQAQHEYLAKFPLWTAQYRIPFSDNQSNIQLYGAWKRWTLWQWRESPDINIYNGEDEEFYKEFNQIKPELPIEENEMSKYFGTVKVVLNVRLAPATGGAVIIQLKIGDKVEASAIINGWWKLTKVIRGTNVLKLPVESYAYQGATNGYILLDRVVDDVEVPPIATDPPFIFVQLPGVNGELLPGNYYDLRK